jgi:hypothetical protein
MLPMVPPALEVHRNGHIYTKAAPLSQWQLYKSFATAKECQDEAGSLPDTFGSAAEKQKHFPLDELRMAYRRCFATDDPRLAK